MVSLLLTKYQKVTSKIIALSNKTYQKKSFWNFASGVIKNVPR